MDSEMLIQAIEREQWLLKPFSDRYKALEIFAHWNMLLTGTRPDRCVK